MGKAALFTLAAVIALVFAPQAPPRATALLALPFLLLAWRDASWRGAALAATIAAAALIQLEWRLAQRVPPAFDGARLELVVRVASLPDANPRRIRFEAEVEHGPLAGRRLLVTWYAPTAAPAAGERWRLLVQLRRPRAALNPGTHDLEASWTVRRIDGLATVREASRLSGAGNGVLATRAALLARIASACGDRPSACGVVGGLAVGHAAGIDDEAWRAFRRTGTVHLVAISGLHVTLLGTLAALLTFALARRSATLTARVPAQVVAALVGLAVATGYAALAGLSLPTLRTVLMLAVVAAAALRRRPASGRGVLAAALLAVLAFDPLAVLAPGFWLSFVGVALLVLCVHEDGVLRGALRAQWVAALGLAPALLAFFGVVPLAAPFANLVAIPLFNLVLVPLVLAGCVASAPLPALGDLCFVAAARLVEWALPALAIVGEVSPTLARGAPSMPALLAATLGTAWLLAPRGLPGRALGLVLWLPLLAAPPRLAAGEFDARVLDVGQGLAVLVMTREHTLVYDTGPGGIDGDAAGWAIVPTLEALGRRADLIMVSHADRDHAGGLVRLVRDQPGAALRVGDGLDGRPCRAGMRWQWDGVRFELLHPAGPLGGNDGSCVLRVASAAGALLLPGDIESAGEAAVLAGGAPLAAEVLVSPHHGSASSSGARFVAAVDPALVVHAVGWRNRWRFPRPEVGARYAAIGARQYETARDGAIDLEFRHGRPPSARRARDERRTWRER